MPPTGLTLALLLSRGQMKLKGKQLHEENCGSSFQRKGLKSSLILTMYVLSILLFCGIRFENLKQNKGHWVSREHFKEFVKIYSTARYSTVLHTRPGSGVQRPGFYHQHQLALQ